jgi:hypothetical protein
MSMPAGLRWIGRRAYIAGEIIRRISHSPAPFRPPITAARSLQSASASGASLVYSTYLGGSGAATPEEANGIAVDASGNAYVAGVANSADFPVTAGAFQVNFKGVSDAFVTKINPAGTAWVYSTYLGGTDLDWASDIGIDGTGNAYAAGYTSREIFRRATRCRRLSEDCTTVRCEAEFRR